MMDGAMNIPDSFVFQKPSALICRYIRYSHSAAIHIDVITTDDGV